MTGVRKKFSPTLYAENDQRARDVVLSFLMRGGSWVRRNDDLYGPDLILYAGHGCEPISYVEVEVKRVWTAGPFPWSTIQIPERKGKLLREALPIEFWVLRADLKEAVIIPGYVVDSSSLVEVPNVLVSSGERFFRVPIEQCIREELVHD